MNLAATNLEAGYPSHPVLSNITIKLEPGELVGLIGPNGCGKSTLLKVISGVMPSSDGVVHLENREMSACPKHEIALKIGFVPQSETAVFDFTVRDIVLMGRHPHHRNGKSNTAEDFAAVNRALAETDAIHLADRPITQLSGGEHRRVLLARALAQQTPLLLLDEPTAHLDITHQVELMQLLLRLTRSERKVGVLAALHDLNQAAEFCDRLILMRSGSILAEGAPSTVINAASLRRAYEADMRVGINSSTGRPMILTIQPARAERNSPDAHRVHLICGGGSGAYTMGALVRQGVHVTTGVLNRLDTDCDTAKALEIQQVLAEPFSSIGREALAEARRLIFAADTTIITDVPFGNGNVPNLELAIEAQEIGKNVILLGSVDITSRDFTDGTATEMISRLLVGGAVEYPKIEDWIDNHFPLDIFAK